MWRMCFEPFRAIRVWISRDRLQTRLGKPSPVGLAGQIVFSRVQPMPLSLFLIMLRF